MFCPEDISFDGGSFGDMRILMIVFCVGVQCTVSCGGGVQMRSVQCLLHGRPSSGCVPQIKPVMSQACNTAFCPQPQKKGTVVIPAHNTAYVIYILVHKCFILLRYIIVYLHTLNKVINATLLFLPPFFMS